MDLLRASCVIGAIVFVLPVPHADKLQTAFDNPSHGQFMSRASKSFTDLAWFCDAQPKACATAEYVVDSVQAKAEFGAQILMDWIDETANQGSVAITSIQAYADQIQTGSISKADDADLRGPLYPDKG